MFQSTHPHGVRREFRVRDYWEVGFNPRTRMGCDLRCLRRGYQPRGFQSTHPHGVRQPALEVSLPRARFNPRTRMGCDRSLPMLGAHLQVSIHAPAWGATLARAILDTHCMFQSTHPHGVRRMAKVGCSALGEFQSTHPHGVRRPRFSPSSSSRVFQSTHPHGVRQ